MRAALIRVGHQARCRPPYSGDPLLRALDKQTGDVTSELELPANQSGIPMTSMMNGTQYIAVAVGGVNKPAELVALTFALADGAPEPGG